MYDPANFLLFSERLELKELYDKWIVENDIRDCPVAVITFLCVNGLINIDKTKTFIKEATNNA